MFFIDLIGQIIIFILESFRIINLVVLGNFLTMAILAWIIWTYASYYLEQYQTEYEAILDIIQDYYNTLQTLTASQSLYTGGGAQPP
jgi:hypothetical protein